MLRGKVFLVLWADFGIIVYFCLGIKLRTQHATSLHLENKHVALNWHTK